MIFFFSFQFNNESYDKDNWQLIITEKEVPKFSLSAKKITRELEHADIILAIPFPAYSTFALVVKEGMQSTENLKDIQNLYAVLTENYPDYVPAFRRVLDGCDYFPCSMFLARRNLVNEYCTWLFDVLAKFEQYAPYQHGRRIPAYLGETLMSVYVYRHNLKFKCYHIAKIADEKLSRRILRRIPFVMRIVHILQRRKQRDMRNIDKFLSRRPSFEGVKRFLLSMGAVNRMKLEAANENLVLAARIIISSETPETVKNSLWESGVRIMEY